MPAHVRQDGGALGIALHVTGDLPLPVISIGRGHARAATAMPVPQASLDKDHGSVLIQNEVGTAWKPLVVEAEAETGCVQRPPHVHLRCGVLRTDLPHDSAALGGGDGIRTHDPFLLVRGAQDPGGPPNSSRRRWARFSNRRACVSNVFLNPACTARWLITSANLAIVAALRAIRMSGCSRRW